MSIKALIKEAKKIIPSHYSNAHSWLEDMLTTHHKLRDPINAIRFFMLGLFASDVIPFDLWHEFDSLIGQKNKVDVH